MNASIGDLSIPSFYDEDDSISLDNFSGDDREPNVSFASTITVVHIPIVLGDNPACSSGPPLQMDPSPDADIVVKTERVDRSHDESRRRLRNGMVLSGLDRWNMLLEAGYSSEQIESITKSIGKVQTSRCDSLMASVQQTKNSRLGTLELAWIQRLVLKTNVGFDEVEGTIRKPPSSRGVQRSNGNKSFRKSILRTVKKMVFTRNRSAAVPLTRTDLEDSQIVLARLA